MKAIAPGHTATLEIRVGEAESIALGGAGDAEAAVFSTPSMIGLMEYAARKALEPCLEPGEESVGVSVEVSHLAPTPLGASVKAVAKVVEAEGRRVDFEVSAFDGEEKIGEGRHRRAAIRLSSFKEAVARKRGGAAPASSGEGAEPVPAFETLSLRRQGAVLQVRLNRLRARNAVDARMTEELEQLQGWVRPRFPEIRAVVLSGAGEAFCAGEDIKENAAQPAAAQRDQTRRRGLICEGLGHLPQVAVAAVNGPAIGGGLMLAAACDFVLAATSARFGLPEATLGWPPAYGIRRVLGIVGKERAYRLCLAGETLTSRAALEAGLVGKVVPSARLAAEAEDLVQRLLALPPLALRETKRQLQAGLGPFSGPGETAAYERARGSEDAREGLRAHLEKRSPQFRGK